MKPDILFSCCDDFTKDIASFYKKRISIFNIEISYKNNFEPFDYDVVCFLYKETNFIKGRYKKVLLLSNCDYAENYDHIITNKLHDDTDMKLKAEEVSEILYLILKNQSPSKTSFI